MENGQSLGSADELQQRRKKKGSLPLAVFLSFNDKDVNPQCPNACNPYHKCGWYCLEKIPLGNKLLDGERSEGSSSEWEKMSEKKGVNPSCPNASNPYHKCSEYCSEKIFWKRQDAVKEPVKIKGEKMMQRASVTPISLKALDFFHKGTEHCFRGSPTSCQAKKNKGILIPGDQSGVNPSCRYASNPYHKCNKYCLGNSPLSDHPSDAINPKNLVERKKMVKNTGRTGVNPQCKYASNPYHKCYEYCFQNEAERDISDGVTISKEGNQTDCGAEERRDWRLEAALIKGKNGGERKERKGVHPMAEKRSLDSGDVAAAAMEASKEITIHVGTNESEPVLVLNEEKKEATMVEVLDSQPLRVDAFDLFKEWAKYCSLKATEDDEGETGQR